MLVIQKNRLSLLWEMLKVDTMNKKEIAYWLLIFAFFTFLSLNRHARAGIFDYHSEIWADKAGYNVYLPALLIYRFDALNFPDSVDYKTGNGFVVDKKNNKIITKYPYGVSLLQSPFWITAYLVGSQLGQKSGYDIIFHQAIDVAASFYFVFGLFFVYKLLNNTKNQEKIALTLLFATSDTNLLYYAV